MKLYTKVNNMRRRAEHKNRNSGLHIFWSYGPLKLKIVDFAIWSCPLCNSKTVQDTFMKLHTNINQH